MSLEGIGKDSPKKKYETVEASPDECVPDPAVPERKVIPQDEYEELELRIKARGRVEKPILARRAGKEYLAKGIKYLIIDGTQRWKIAKELGLKEIPVRIYDVDDDEALDIALATADVISEYELDRIRRIRARYNAYIRKGVAEDEAINRIADNKGKSREYVLERLRIAENPYFAKIIDFLDSGGCLSKASFLGIKYLRELFKIDDLQLLKHTLQRALDESWSLERLERFVETYQDERKHAGRLIKKPEKFAEKVEEKALEKLKTEAVKGVGEEKPKVGAPQAGVVEEFKLPGEGVEKPAVSTTIVEGATVQPTPTVTKVEEKPRVKRVEEVKEKYKPDMWTLDIHRSPLDIASYLLWAMGEYRVLDPSKESEMCVVEKVTVEAEDEVHKKITIYAIGYDYLLPTRGKITFAEDLSGHVPKSKAIYDLNKVDRKYVDFIREQVERSPEQRKPRIPISTPELRVKAEEISKDEKKEKWEFRQLLVYGGKEEAEKFERFKEWLSFEWGREYVDAADFIEDGLVHGYVFEKEDLFRLLKRRVTKEYAMEATEAIIKKAEEMGFIERV